MQRGGKNRGPPAGAVAAAGGGGGDGGGGKGKKGGRSAAFTPVDLASEYPSELSQLPVASLVLFSLSLSVYVATMHRTVSGGDNGELLGCACELGVAHPPGYPTFTVLGFCFAKLLPFGTPAFRVAIMCAGCNAAAACLIMASVQRLVLLRHKLSGGGGEGEWLGSVYAGFFAGGMFALSPLIWLYSLQAEVFALNDLFSALLVLFAVRFNETRDPPTAYLGAFLIGLGLTNQHTLIFFALPIVLWALSVRPSLLTPQKMLTLIACGLLGLSPYLLLFPLGTYSPLGSWGQTGTIQGFFKHLLRQEYGTFALYSGSDGQPAQLIPATMRYFKHLTTDSLYVGIPVLLFGLYDFSRSLAAHPASSPALVLVGTWVFYLVVFHSLSNLPIDKKKIFLGIHMRFWLQPHILSFLFMGVGVRPMLSAAGGWRKWAVLPAIAACLAAQVGSNYRALDQSDNRHIAELGRKHLEFLPPNAIMISQGDMVTNAMRYLQRCEKYRQDVLLLDETMMTYKWMRDVQGPAMKPWKIKFPNQLHSPHPFTGGYTMEEFLRLNGNRPEHPVFKAGAWLGDMVGAADSGVPSWQTIPLGLHQMVVPKGLTYPADEWMKHWYDNDIFPSLPDHYDPRYDEYSWEWLDRRIVLEYRAKVGFHWANLAVETRDLSHLTNARENLEDILKYEEMAHGHEGESYILSDLHNALGMLWIHIQHHFEQETEEMINSNRKIAHHFGEFVRLTPHKERKNGQEKNLVDYFKQVGESFGGLVIPTDSYEQQRKDEEIAKLQQEEKGRKYLAKQRAAAERVAMGGDDGGGEGKKKKKRKDKEGKRKSKTEV